MSTDYQKLRERQATFGALESMYYMSQGRTPSPRRYSWKWLALGVLAYVVIGGILMSLLHFYGARA